ncbi:hypothetical protein FS749_013241 [Ceratobasidium sp. UAMH 11750]|nr:hypothetical protein FS749_013241 [Ceratobasidium sp. UAMH 11750]
MHTLSLNCSISDISDNFLGADSANHVPEVIDLSDRDDALVPPPTAYILGRLQQEGDLPVLLALARFLQADDSTHSSDLALDCVPTNVSHKVPLQDINQLYELWLSTPCPPSPRLTEVEQQLRSIPKSEHDGYLLHTLHSSRSFHLPLTFLACWHSLSTLKRYCTLWSNALSWLTVSATLGDRSSNLSLECMQRITTVPLHHKHPGIPEVFSSDLPLLLSSRWLTDVQINAAGDYINSHPSRTPHLRVLHSHFIGTLALHFNPSEPWAPRRARPVDSLIAQGVITELLVPVHHAEGHWSFLWVNITSETYTHNDTLHLSSTQAPYSCMRLMNWWISSVLNRPVYLTNARRTFTLGSQSDGHSCGVAVITSMAHIALNNHFTAWTQDSTTCDRMDWFLHLSEDIRLSPIVDEYPVFDVDLDDIVQPSFSAFAPFTKDVESEIVHPPIDTMSSLLAPSSPSLIDIDSSSDSEHLDAASDMEVHLSNPSSAPLTSSPPAPLIQSTLPFKQVSCKEWREQERRRWEESQEQRALYQEMERLQKDRKEAKRKAYQRLKKQAQRARHKALRAQLASVADNQSPKVCV